MKPWTLLLSLLIASYESNKFVDQTEHHFIVLELAPGTSPSIIEDTYNLEYYEPVISVPNHYVFKSKVAHNKENNIKQIIESHQQRMDLPSHKVAKSILDIEHQKVSKVYKRKFLPFKKVNTRELQIRTQFGIADPGFGHQWHIKNNKIEGNDLNLIPVWQKGYTGKGVTVAFVDDGLDHENKEFTYKYLKEGSYDFNTNTTNPNPKTKDDKHGTRCAGEVSAAKDDQCGVGIAYDSNVSGIRALAAPLYAHSEANALSYRNDINDIYSCSWGPKDDGQSIGEPAKVAQKSIINSIKNGRQGKGNVYIFASGNGGMFKDNCNFDGYVNSIYTIAVGAIDHKNQHPTYSEGCTALLLVTYSGDDFGGNTIYTSDNFGKCTARHSGTSAAGPLVSGVVALALEARPDLTWRDIQHLIVQNSVPISLEHPSWTTTFNGRPYSHLFGYGKMDANKFISAAENFQNVLPQTQIDMPLITVNQNIPEDDYGIERMVTVTPQMLKDNNFDILEHVTVKFNLAHQRRKDVEIELISPNGIISKLIESRPHDKSREGFEDWTAMTVKHFYEPVIGNWKIRVKDIHHHNFKHGQFKDFKVTFYGQQKPKSSHQSFWFKSFNKLLHAF